jgi:ribosomal protein S18 acetylase RimI-like enzyme
VSEEAAGIRIRGARADDVRRLAEIARAAYAKYVPRIGREPAPMAADYAAAVAAGRVAVLERAGTVAGYMIAWPEADAYVIDNVAVDPAAQGLGLGRRLIDHATEEERRRGRSSVRLYTNAAMHENRAMYARMGFVETHRAVDEGFDRVFMRRDLATG